MTTMHRSALPSCALALVLALAASTGMAQASSTAPAAKPATGAAKTAAAAASAANAGNSCPATVTGQYEKVAAFQADGAGSSIDGFTPMFTPMATLRLVNAQLAVAHGGEKVPSEMLPPDDIAASMGRTMKWTLWDGRPPEPLGVVHLLCEYEGGLLLHKPVGRTVRSCELVSAVQKPTPKSATPRVVATKAVFNCR